MSKREMGLRYEPSPQALRAIAEELRAVGVELDSPSIRRALSAALEIEGPRLEQMAREEAEAEIRSLRAAHQDALRILLEASGAEVRAVPPRAQVPVSQAPTLQMPSVPPQPKPAPPDPFDEPVLTPRDAVARRRPTPPREPVQNPPAPAAPPAAASAQPDPAVPANANLTDLVRQRLGDEAPAERTPLPRNRDDEPKRPIFRRGRRG